MPLLTGIWKINVNGTEGDLTITSLQPEGFISGTVLGVAFLGFWTESGKSIFFETMTPIGIIPAMINSPARTTGGDNRAQFTGYLFSTPPFPSSGSDIKWTLCGKLTTPPMGPLPAAQPTAHRSSFGWFANVTQVI